MGCVSLQPRAYPKRVQRIFVEALTLLARQEVGNGHHHKEHEHHADDALIAHNGHGHDVHVRHEKVFKRDLAGLHTLLKPCHVCIGLITSLCKYLPGMPR